MKSKIQIIILIISSILFQTAMVQAGNGKKYKKTVQELAAMLPDTLSINAGNIVSMKSRIESKAKEIDGIKLYTLFHCEKKKERKILQIHYHVLLKSMIAVEKLRKNLLDTFDVSTIKPKELIIKDSTCCQTVEDKIEPLSNSNLANCLTNKLSSMNKTLFSAYYNSLCINQHCQTKNVENLLVKQQDEYLQQLKELQLRLNKVIGFTNKQEFIVLNILLMELKYELIRNRYEIK